MKRCQPWLGTYVEIRADGLGEDALHAAIDDAFAAIATVHRLMSFHDPDSDLSRLNREAHEAPVAVHPWTAEVIAWALRFHVATEGLFDCAIAPTLVRWQRLPGNTGMAARDEPAGSLRDVHLRDDGRVFFAAPLALDLGGIAKGYAVDRAIDVLRAAGVTHAVVNTGGDLRILGELPETVQVRHPADPARLVTLGALADGALATSASYFVREDAQDTTACALVDPRTRTAAGGGRSHTVIADTCVVADALTKPLAICGDPQAPWLDAFHAKGIVL